MPETIIVFENGCPHRRQLEHWYADCDSQPAATIQLSFYHAMLGAVIVGMGLRSCRARCSGPSPRLRGYGRTRCRPDATGWSRIWSGVRVPLHRGLRRWPS